jgi:hypothetical protein
MENYMKTGLNRYRNVILKMIFTVVIALLMMQISSSAMAAGSSPKLKKESVTLYIHYKTYTMKIDNLNSKSTVTFQSDNEKIAKVSNAGIITPVSVGTTTVTALVKQNSKKYTLKTNVTVKNPYVKLTKRADILVTGESFTYTAKVYGNSEAVTWSSSDDTVLKINSGSGKAKALSAGTAYITISAGFVSTSFLVTVQVPEVTETDAAGSSASEIGSSDSNGDKIPEDSVVELSSDNSFLYHEKLSGDNANDAIYYHFKLDTITNVDIDLSLDSGMDPDSVNMKLVDQNNNKLYDSEYNSNYNDYVLEFSFLPAGDYYAVVYRTNGKSNADITYYMYHYFAPRDLIEGKDNSDDGDYVSNLMSTAASIENEEFYYGTIANVQDVDYYKVISGGSIYASLDFNNRIDQEYLSIMVIDTNNKVVGYGELELGSNGDADSCDAHLYDLPDGGYYIVVYCTDKSMVNATSYRLYVSYY